MAILNQFGQPFVTASTFAHAADRSRFRGPQFSIRSESIEKLIPPRDRRTLVSLSQRLYTNKGVVTAAVDQKAEYSVGSAYLPEYLGADVEAGDRVESWLMNVWFPNCDVRGGVFDLQRTLVNCSRGIDKEGECFVLLTETNEGGFPLIQIIEPYRVRSDYMARKVADGPFAGAKIHDGVIYNARMRPIAYRVYDDEGNFEDIPARSIIHLFDPSYHEQGRGLPAFTHALGDLVHCLQSTEDERRRQAILSGLGLIVHNELGGPDLTDPSVGLATDTSAGTARPYESTQGIYYLTANSGEKLEQIKHESPGDVWEAFHDRMIREAITGVGWSYSLVWKPTGQGTAERGEILRARRAIAARQKLLDYLFRRVVTYAVAYATERGDVPRLSAPLAWRATKPPRLSVDDGREAAAERDAYRLGSTNMTDIQEGGGRTFDNWLSTRIREAVKIKRAIHKGNQELADIGATIDPREIVMLTPNETPQPQNTQSNGTDPTQQPERQDPSE